VQFLTGGKAREPRNRLTWLISKADSKVWMKEDVVDTSLFLYPEDLSSGYFYDLTQFVAFFYKLMVGQTQ
jgi:hypothetical protein